MRGRAKVLAINESYRLAPWADVIYACDGAWWRSKKGLPEFNGLRLSHDTSVCRDFDIERLWFDQHDDKLKTEEPAIIGDGGNSGFQGLNAAVQFGAKKIILVGFDMRLDKGVHWHGRHPRGLNNPTGKSLARWRSAIDGAAPVLKRLGVQVYNASPVSTLTAYPFVSLEDILC